MKPAITVLILFLSVFTLKGQDFGKAGATWHFREFHDFNYGLETTIEIESIGDSTILGFKSFKIHSSSRSWLCHYFPTTPYIRSDSNKVWFWVEEQSRFNLLYDFSLKQGDTWQIDFYDQMWEDNRSMYVKVDSTRLITINGQVLNQQFVTYYYDSTMTKKSISSEIIEGIGDQGFIFNWPVGVGWCDGSWGGGLRCFEDSILGFYNSGISDDCQYDNVSLEELENYYLVKIYPNPTSDILNIKLNKNRSGKVELYSTQGRLVLQRHINISDEVQVNHLPKGAYILRIRGADFTFKPRKIILN